MRTREHCATIATIPVNYSLKIEIKRERERERERGEEREKEERTKSGRVEGGETCLSLYEKVAHLS